MDRRTVVRTLALVLALAAAGSAAGQFFEGFDSPEVTMDPAAANGWAFFTGDGQATMQLVHGQDGYATILTDDMEGGRGLCRKVGLPADPSVR